MSLSPKLSRSQHIASKSNSLKGVKIIVYKYKLHGGKKRRKIKLYEYKNDQLVRVPSSSFYFIKDKGSITQCSSLPEILNKKHSNKNKIRKKKSNTKSQQMPFKSKYTVNLVAECRDQECLNFFNNPLNYSKLGIYRCQLATAQESCCCSCNSDAMFEVMKSLYDCYKKKNCDHCNCILCGHLPREERKLAELRKSGIDLGAGVSAKQIRQRREALRELEKIEKELKGKSPAEKEKILKELAAQGVPLPEPKTASEKSIMKRVKTQTDANLLDSLKEKSSEEKEKILKQHVEKGLSLPEGRNPSEKALIQKVKEDLAKHRSKGKAEEAKISKAIMAARPSEKLQKAKAAGLLTPLEGKTPEQREKILRGLAQHGIPLPEGKTVSEKKIIDKVRADLGLPPEPKTASAKQKYAKAQADGLITPLEGKSSKEKEKIIRAQAAAGLPLPEGRTSSEKAMIDKIKAGAPEITSAAKIPSEKLRKAKAAGLITPLEGKTLEQKENIIRGLAKSGIPLPEPKTASEKKLIDKVRTEMGLPPEPKTPSIKQRYAKAQAEGLITPLEGKSPAEKEKILKAQAAAGLPLPEGRTPSEKALIAKIKTEAPAQAALSKIPSEKLRKAKAAGLITPLEGKTPEQKEKILRGLAAQGIPLPEGKTPSDKKLIDKVRTEMGLPPEPKSPSIKQRYAKAQADGLITPLEGKSTAEKEKILKAQAAAGLPLPEGRTPSEKALIQKIKESAPEKRKSRVSAEPAIIGPGRPALTPEKAAKLEQETLKNIKEGTGPVDECICGLLTPESERRPLRSVKSKVPTKITSEKLKAAKAAGLLTPLESKTPAQREKILRGLAQQGLPLPEAKSESEKKLIDKVRADLGLPPEPRTSSAKQRYAKAQGDGLITPLEGKTAAQKEKILKAQADAGLPLPEGRTSSEKALIAKIKASPGKVPSEKLRKAKVAGLITPLEGKKPEQKEKILRGLAAQGIPLPEGKTPSDKKLIDKVRTEMGLPPEPKSPSMKQRYVKAQADGLITPLEGKSPAEKEKILKAQAAAGLPLPEGRTPSERALIAKIKASAPPPGKQPLEVVKIPSEKLRKAKAAGLITPLEGKTPEQKEKILRGLAAQGIPLPEGKTLSDKKLIDKVRTEMGLPPEPKTPSIKQRYARAQAEGLITPLEGKSPAEKEKILKAQAAAGLPLPEGRTPSERALIAKIKASAPPTRKEPPEVVKIPSEKLRKAKAAGLITPLEGKTPEQKEKILRGLAAQGIPLPEGKTLSDKKLIDKVRTEMGLPPGPKTPSVKQRYAKAQAEGLITPLEGKSPGEKEKILKAQAAAGLPLPEGRTPSERALIAKIKASAPPPGKEPLEVVKIPSEKLRKAKAAGLITPLEGKTPEQKEKILRGLAAQGIPLPEGKTLSDKKLIDKVRTEMGLPPEPKTPSIKQRYARAQAEGLITPLEGKSPAEKEKILKAQAAAGLPLPEGRTPSERALIAKIKASAPPTGKEPLEVVKIPSEKLRKAKAAGLITPLEGKTPEQKEKILKGLAAHGIPLPEGKTASEKKLIDNVRAEMGLPPEPKTLSTKQRYAKAQADGLITPLEGKSPAEKEKILKRLAAAGLPLPEGRAPSEKALIAKIKAEAPAVEPSKIPSEKLRRAKAAGLLTPLEGKTPEQKEKIIRELIKARMPLPEGKTPSEKALINKIKDEAGLPPEPKTPSLKEKYKKALSAGLITPLENKSHAEKKKILKALHDAGVELPEGRTSSEKALIAKVKATPREGLPPLEGKAELGIPPQARTPSEKEVVRKAKAEGLLTPLSGKTQAQKEKILKGLAEAGLPLPEGKTNSEKSMIKKIRTAAGLPPEPTPSEKGRIKTKSKKIGEGKILRKASARAVEAKVPGIGEEFEDIVKTTTCDRGCGCDKKKIRFKHSYIKIRVTSPDISSLCPCPNECLPGVKGGIFTDNEGIKVTVGSAIGVPSFKAEKENKDILIHYIRDKQSINKLTEIDALAADKIDKAPGYYSKSIQLLHIGKHMFSYSEQSIPTVPNFNEEAEVLFTTNCDNERTLLKRTSSVNGNEMKSSTYLITCTESYGSLYFTSGSLNSKADLASTNASYISIVVKKELSLSFLSTSSTASIDTISVISIHESSITPTSSHYICCPSYSEIFTNDIDYSIDINFSDENKSRSLIQSEYPTDVKSQSAKKAPANDVIIYRMSQKYSDGNKRNKVFQPRAMQRELDLDRTEMYDMINEVLDQDNISVKSSIFVIVPTSDEDESSLSESASSMVCLRFSENFFWSKNKMTENKYVPKQRGNFGFKITKNPKYQLQNAKFSKNNKKDASTTDSIQYTEAIVPKHETDSAGDSIKQYVDEQNIPKQVNDHVATYRDQITTSQAKTDIVYKATDDSKYTNSGRHNLDSLTFAENKNCQVDITGVISHRVAMDTTEDRPCCCEVTNTQTDSDGSSQRTVTFQENVASEIMKPIIASQGESFVLSQEAFYDITKVSEPFCPELTLSEALPMGIYQQTLQNCQSVSLQVVPSANFKPNHKDYPSEQTLTANLCSHEIGIETYEIPFEVCKRPYARDSGIDIAPADTCHEVDVKQITREDLQAPPPPCISPSCGPKSRDDQGRALCDNRLECTGGCDLIPLSPPPLPPPLPPAPIVLGSSDCNSCGASYCDHKKKKKKKPCTCGSKESTKCVCHSKGWRKYKTNECPCTVRQTQTPVAGLVPGAVGFPMPPGALPSTVAGLEAAAGLLSGVAAGIHPGAPGPPVPMLPPGFTLGPGFPAGWPPGFPYPRPATTDNGNECPVCKETEEEKRQKHRRGSKRNKNFTCECPPNEPEPEDFFIEIDERAAMKLRSDMTQTTSGFNVKFRKRPIEVNLSFEDAVAYYQEIEGYQGEFIDPEKCDCDGKKKKKSDVDCECPYVPPENLSPLTLTTIPSEPDLKGLKVSIGGKGSASKGLHGICCFDLIIED